MQIKFTPKTNEFQGVQFTGANEEDIINFLNALYGNKGSIIAKINTNYSQKSPRRLIVTESESGKQWILEIDDWIIVRAEFAEFFLNNEMLPIVCGTEEMKILFEINIIQDTNRTQKE